MLVTSTVDYDTGTCREYFSPVATKVDYGIEPLQVREPQTLLVPYHTRFRQYGLAV